MNPLCNLWKPLLLLVLFLPSAHGQDVPRPLGPAQPIERELAGGESHFYSIKLDRGQLVHVRVEQRGIDVVLSLFATDGKKLIEVDSPSGAQGPEHLWAMAESM